MTNETYDWWLKMSELEFYAWYDNIFTNEELDFIENIVSDPDLFTAKINTNSNTDLSVRNSNIQFISSNDPNNKWIFERLTGLINSANERYFNFDLNRIETLQYTVYNEGQFYKDHIDLGYINPNKAVRKLSFTLQLTDPSEYEGGELLIKCGSEPQVGKKARGSITFFPSYILHEVTKVTKGTRKSIVGWVTGPSWR
jgi:PKHD-type hydroxylase